MDPAQLAALQQAMAAKGVHEHKAPAPGACSKPEPLEDLERTTSVLNATNSDAIKAVMSFPAPADGPSEPLQSDSDEQLLVTIQLRQIYKLHSLKVSGPADGSAPSTIKLFINRDNMDFNDAEDLPPTQTLELKGASATLPLQFTKFQAVSSLTVFLESNQGDTESTALSRLELIGVPVETTSERHDAAALEPSRARAIRLPRSHTRTRHKSMRPHTRSSTPGTPAPRSRPRLGGLLRLPLLVSQT